MRFAAVPSACSSASEPSCLIDRDAASIEPVNAGALRVLRQAMGRDASSP